MTRMRVARAAVAGIIALTTAAAIPLVSGCRAESEMSKEEQENFKGGPMPPDYNPNAPAGPPAGGGAGAGAGTPGASAAGAGPAGAPPGPAGTGAGATGR